MRADFFVHPDYHQLKGLHSTDKASICRSYESYMERLMLAIESSSNPVLVHNYYCGDSRSTNPYLWDLFEGRPKIATQQGHGRIGNEEGWHQLEELLEEGMEEAVVHGSYAGLCLLEFATELKSICGNEAIAPSVKYGTILARRHMMGNLAFSLGTGRLPNSGLAPRRWAPFRTMDFSVMPLEISQLPLIRDETVVYLTEHECEVPGRLVDAIRPSRVEPA